MSYGRNPHYIYSNGEELFLDGVYVKEELINKYLYNLETNDKEKLEERVKKGEKYISKKRLWNANIEGDIYFEGVCVKEKVLNVFLYNLITTRPEEFKERVEKGRQSINI